jgi:hypothetical protein
MRSKTNSSGSSPRATSRFHSSPWSSSASMIRAASGVQATIFPWYGSTTSHGTRARLYGNCRRSSEYASHVPPHSAGGCSGSTGTANAAVVPWVCALVSVMVRPRALLLCSSYHPPAPAVQSTKWPKESPETTPSTFSVRSKPSLFSRGCSSKMLAPREAPDPTSCPSQLPRRSLPPGAERLPSAPRLAGPAGIPDRFLGSRMPVKIAWPRPPARSGVAVLRWFCLGMGVQLVLWGCCVGGAIDLPDLAPAPEHSTTRADAVCLANAAFLSTVGFGVALVSCLAVLFTRPRLGLAAALFCIAAGCSFLIADLSPRGRAAGLSLVCLLIASGYAARKPCAGAAPLSRRPGPGRGGE